jgi:SAM-dependent methyltransferase
MSQTAERQKEEVREAYGEIARNRVAQASADCCAPPEADPDYSAEEIASVPEGAFLGEGSGNPVRAARLQPGEVVVDLGSGAGMDVFLAANQVGKSGRVIGLDMTPEMLERARALAAAGDYPQVEFQRADIENLPLPDNSADVVLSNCVINLTTDKAKVYREIFRVLKPGGRFAVSDIVLRGQAELVYRAADKLPGCSCLKTALEENAYQETVSRAGFDAVGLTADRPAASHAEVEKMARALGFDPKEDRVSAHAVTLIGRKPEA